MGIFEITLKEVEKKKCILVLITILSKTGSTWYYVIILLESKNTVR